MAEQGPRIGDAASLWNFTPAPGWSREEAQVLKICLMKYGIGRCVLKQGRSKDCLPCLPTPMPVSSPPSPPPSLIANQVGPDP